MKKAVNLVTVFLLTLTILLTVVGCSSKGDKILDELEALVIELENSNHSMAAYEGFSTKRATLMDETEESDGWTEDQYVRVQELYGRSEVIFDKAMAEKYDFL